jgi:hypothetical protein
MTNFKWQRRHKIGAVLVALDTLWVLTWVAFLFVYQFGGASLDYRNAFSLLAFHGANLATLLAAIDRFGRGDPHGIVLVLFLFAVATDLASLLEAAKYLPQTEIQWPMQMAMAIIALVLSSSSFLWYVIYLFAPKHKQYDYRIEPANKKGLVRYF